MDVKTETTEILVEGLNSDMDAVHSGDKLDGDSDCEEDENSKDKQKKGRGRPRRNYSEEAEEPVKRGRGRPRKIKHVDDISLGEAATDGSNGIEEKGREISFRKRSYESMLTDFKVLMKRLVILISIS